VRRKNALDAKFEGYLSYMYTYVENKMIKVTKRLGIKNQIKELANSLTRSSSCFMHEMRKISDDLVE